MLNKDKINKELHSYEEKDDTVVNSIKDYSERLVAIKEERNLYEKTKVILKKRLLTYGAFAVICCGCMVLNFVKPLHFLINCFLGVTLFSSVIEFSKTIKQLKSTNKMLKFNKIYLDIHKEALENLNTSHSFNKERIQDLRDLMHDKTLTDEQIVERYNCVYKAYEKELTPKSQNNTQPTYKIDLSKRYDNNLDR